MQLTVPHTRVLGAQPFSNLETDVAHADDAQHRMTGGYLHPKPTGARLYDVEEGGASVYFSIGNGYKQPLQCFLGLVEWSTSSHSFMHH